MSKLRAKVEKYELFCQKMNERSTVMRYSLATLAVGLAFGARLLLHPLLQDRLPLSFFLTGGILAALFGGFGPGLYALVFGFLLADYFFLPPVGSIGSYGSSEWVRLVTTILPGLLAISAISLLQGARRKLRVYTKQIAEAKEHLEQEVTIRTAELKASVSFLENFCYAIAHDLRSPLRAINGGATLLEEECAGQLNEESEAAVAMLLTGTVRMDKMIEELLRYGRLNHQETFLTPTVLNSLIRRVIQAFEADVDSARAKVIYDETSSEPVLVDAKLLELALSNVLANALKFGRKDTPLVVKIQVEEASNRVRILVRDNGIGIEPQYHEKLFHLFQQLEATPDKGMGTGLAIAKKAIERMRGSMGVESELGRGSTFWLEVMRAPRAEREALNERGPDPINLGRRKFDAPRPENKGVG
ncbi:MAG: Integral rane sensor signal transduction histidine kinase [Pedosphaera sp.]|nr:Integral rane sensor signal transduction histidine kinase [Pedosphaera sp.]